RRRRRASSRRASPFGATSYDEKRCAHPVPPRTTPRSTTARATAASRLHVDTGSPALLLQDDDPLPRPRDRIGELRVGIPPRLDLLEFETMQEELITDQRLDRAELLVEDGRDPVIE